MSLLELPGEILVPILALAAEQELQALHNVSLTCKVLHDLVDRDVWRQLHHLKYDDPSKACAFAHPRKDFDWKQRVLDRDYTIKFLQENELPSPNSDRDVREAQIAMLREHEARAFSTIIGMYHDLPSLGTPSRNAPILTAIGEHPLVALLCGSELFDDDDMLRHHTHAILLSMGRKYRSLAAQEWFTDNRDVLGEYLPPQDQTDWLGLKADAAFAVHVTQFFGDNFPQYLGNADMSLIAKALAGGIDAVRGSGILDLRRPLSLDDSEIWDWAGVQGQWYATLTNRRMARWSPPGPYPEPILLDPDTFDVLPAASPKAILDAYHSTSGEADSHLWDDLSANVYDDTLPPVYFYGTSQSMGPASKFIFGVVHLTHDEPPELRWDLGIVDRATPGDSVVYQGVQVGGPAAKRGVFGQYKFWKRRSCKDEVVHEGQHADANGVNGDDCTNGHGDGLIPPNPVWPNATGEVDEDYGAVDFRTRTDGMGWLFKIDPQCPVTDQPSEVTQEQL